METKASLHFPHAKCDCVNFQTQHGTLKGIANTWEVVSEDQGGAWENQQHGRGHHLKVLIKKPRLGAKYQLGLLREDGTPVPNYTLTKAGHAKSTALIGVDAREWTHGLMWNKLACEGSRKWLPMSACIVSVGEPGTAPVAQREAAATTPAPSDNASALSDSEKFLLAVPSDLDLVIPIRIEVLSAVKGAGNFTRYCVHVMELPEKATGGSSGFAWRSPPVLVEAKWLPAAPVRTKNKKRLAVQRGSNDEGASGGFPDGGQAIQSIDDFVTLSQSMEAFLTNKNNTKALESDVLCDAATKLHTALVSYSAARRAQISSPGSLPLPSQGYGAYRKLVHNTQIGGGSRKGLAPPTESTNASAQVRNAVVRRNSGTVTSKRKQSAVAREESKLKTARTTQVLSSPPRGPRVVSFEAMAQISLPQSAAIQPPKLEESSSEAKVDEEGFPCFDHIAVLAAAASTKSPMLRPQVMKNN